MEGTTEIISYLDAKFSALDAYLEKRFDKAMSTALATFATSEEVADARADIRRLDGRIDGIYHHLNRQAQREEALAQELTTLGSQVSRHERWHEEAAKRLGFKLKS